MSINMHLKKHVRAGDITEARSLEIRSQWDPGLKAGLAAVEARKKAEGLI